jgi:hypothetical protein
MTGPTVGLRRRRRLIASSDRRGEHPQKHLAAFAGMLQARRGFFELADIEKTAWDGQKGKPISPFALEGGNAAERALRGIALGRRNWTFAGSLRGADRAAIILTWSRPAASTMSIPRPGSPTSSPASPIFPLRVCTNCCPGNGSFCAEPTSPTISKPPYLHHYHRPRRARAHAQSGGLRRMRTFRQIAREMVVGPRAQ